MTVQRTQFILATGVNRTDDPADTVVASAPRLLPKGADVLGAQVAIRATTLGDAVFSVALQGTNQPDGADPSQPDAGANWVPASLPSSFSAALGTEARILNPLTQNVTLAPFLFVRATLQLDDGDLSTVEDLEVQVHCKTDYRVG